MIKKSRTEWIYMDKPENLRRPMRDTKMSDFFQKHTITSAGPSIVGKVECITSKGPKSIKTSLIPMYFKVCQTAPERAGGDSLEEPRWASEETDQKISGQKIQDQGSNTNNSQVLCDLIQVSKMDEVHDPDQEIGQ